MLSEFETQFLGKVVDELTDVVEIRHTYNTTTVATLNEVEFIVAASW
jgi:hypothetical protein